MITRTFERAFKRLVASFKRYHDTWRTAENIHELATARWNLEEARVDMRRQRDRTTSAPAPSDRSYRKMAISEDGMARLRFAALGGDGSGGAHFALGPPEIESKRIR